ncbi:MAG: GNAT family N-acetyltransferase [Thermoplasmata archaeon]|nr:MAG: GNAT family N-acetyltransferase [Thermoplasmata archaeon]
MPDQPTIRPLSMKDLDDIIKIEKSIFKGRRKSLWENGARYYIEQGEAQLNLGAELDGELVGFIIGDIRQSEFGLEEKIGWVKVLGVAPAHQGVGIGGKLGFELMENFKRQGVKTVKTFVEWDSGDLITYFKSVGFGRDSMISLVKKL